MRALLWLLTLAALAVGLSLAARYNDGYLLVVLPPWRAELSLNLAVLLAAAGFLLIYFLLRVLVNALRLPRAVQEFRECRQRQKADARLRDAMRLLQEGRPRPQGDRARGGVLTSGPACSITSDLR